MKYAVLGFVLASSLGVSWALESPTGLEALEKEIPNFHVVDGAVFRGGRPNEEALRDLDSVKIDTVVDLQGGDIHGRNPVLNLVNLVGEPGEKGSAIRHEQQLALENGIHNFFSIPLNSNDPVSAKEARKIDEALEILHDREDEPVYVHCAHGKDRTGLLVALYEVKYHHMTPEAAHDEMVAMGHKGFFDKIFTGNLDKFFWKVAPDYYAASEPSSKAD